MDKRIICTLKEKITIDDLWWELKEIKESRYIQMSEQDKEELQKAIDIVKSFSRRMYYLKSKY